MPEPYVFDAYALLALLTEEAGAEQVAAILEDEKSAVYVSAINLGEVYHILLRRRRPEAARQAEMTIFQQRNLQLVEPGWPQISSVAEIKPEGGLSFTDAFAAALARQLSAPIVTGDPEFAGLEQRRDIRGFLADES